MISPFPGMDPYLEGPHWPDFHDRLINSLSETIAEELPPGYDTEIRDRVYLLESGEVPRRFEPDVAIERDQTHRAAVATRTVEEEAMSNPVTLPLRMLDPVREPYIEIYSLPDREVIAVVEILSPTNKTGRGRVEYLDKRDEVLRAPVHLVEIDLLLGGSRVPLGAPLPGGDYFVLISPADRRHDCDVYAWNIREVMPKFSIPLRSGDPAVAVKLRSAFDLAYARGRYTRKLNYDQPPPSRVPDADRQWVVDTARTAGQSNS